MESTAILRFSGISARKMRQMADLVRGKDVVVALHSLQFVTRVAARPMEKLIQSAVANAREKANAADERFDSDALYVKTVVVDEGPTMKRFRPRAQGRAYRIRKRSCHVNLVLQEREGRKVRARRRPAAAEAAAAPESTAKGKKTAKPATKTAKPAAKTAKTGDTKRRKAAAAK